ncbi:hypothetical protein EDC01DRAFT_640508 [Geopyxis carbonaria]|nr:hypothetical protein EDC01DRAFT_640508 [Geopyxis carbonaria]
MTEPPKKYRTAINPPYNLNDRLRVSLEERLYPQALEFFNALLFSGGSLEEPKPGLMPSASYVRLVTTLLVHPYYTTQTRSHIPASTAPGDAHILLCRLLNIYGPMNADLTTAWRFEKETRPGRKNRWDGSRSPSISLDDSISGELANEESLFSSADDLWAIVGWAFNCSVAHPKRWSYWKNALDILYLGLELDLKQRVDSQGDSNISNSLIVRMLPDSRGSGGYRRVVRSVFANGIGKASNEFKQIWPDELLKKRPRQKGKRGLDSVTANSESESETDEVVEKTINEAQKEEDMEIGDTQLGISSAIRAWGGIEALHLRQKFLSLLSVLSKSGDFISLEDLFHEYKEFILPLSIPSFSLYTSTFLPADPKYRSSLNQVILEAIISTNSPRRLGNDMLDQEVLIHRYLPFPANKKHSVIDNAKVAMLLETLMRLLFNNHLLKWTPELEKAVEKGIAARKKSGTVRAVRGAQENTDEVKSYWKAAEDKLNIMVKILKVTNRDIGIA